MSIVYRSVKGSKLTSDEVDGNFRYLDSSINPDRIISLGTETISGNQRTYEGYKWQINGVEIDNIGNPIQLNFPSATVGFKRNDISVFKADGTIERIAGIETDGDIVSPPDVPEGTLYFKTYSIDGDAVESEPEPTVIDGSIFKKKSENSSLKITATGEEQIINLSLGGQMHYIVTSAALISVAGFSPHLLNMGGNALYPGQDLIFENQTGNPVTLINAHTIAPIKFNEGADIIVPNGGKLWFRINEEFAKIIMKSWIEASDVLEFADLASFPATGESGKIYLALDTNLQYRWSGSAYVQIGGGSERKYFETLGNRFTLGTINAFYSSGTENGLVSDNINSGVGTILTSSMGIRWVTPLLITDKICKLKNFKFRATDNLGGFTQLRIIFFIGQSINGQSLRINNQIIHDETITMASGGQVTFFERNTFTNDVTIPKGYDLCYLISRLDGTGTNLYNVKISGYVE